MAFFRRGDLEILTSVARRPDGIFVAPFELGEIGPDLFRAACNMGLEGIVSKRRDRPYAVFGLKREALHTCTVPNALGLLEWP
jgi:ATP-dependent DNA ligase